MNNGEGFMIADTLRILASDDAHRVYAASVGRLNIAGQLILGTLPKDFFLAISGIIRCERRTCNRKELK